MGSLGLMPLTRSEAHSGNLNPQQTLMIRMESEQYVSIGTGELGAFWSQ